MNQTNKPKLYLINGPLGAGKTTLLRFLLSQPNFKDARVIENEFASLSVDSDQLHDHQAEVKTIAGLCICCSTGDELADALRTLATSPEPVIIESTGVANSLLLLEKIITAGALEDYELAHGVFILDAAEAARHPELVQSHHDELQAADTVLLSKVDLISPAEHQTILDLIPSSITTPPLTVKEGVVALKSLARPSLMLDFFAHYDGVIRRHDTLANYSIVNLETLAISPGGLRALWPHLQSSYDLQRMKGTIIDQHGTSHHVEATPSQYRATTPGDQAAQLVFIGTKARDISRTVLEGELQYV